MGSRASFADSPRHRGKRVGNKKRPQVESCDPLKNKRRNKSNKRKHRIAEIELRRKGDSRMNQGVVTARARLRQAGLLTGEGYERTDRGKRRKLTQSK